MNSTPKHMKLLERLLKLPENKECADCKSKAPRWTSINLGIFICLQCSGIHRSLGVHISKVRSATLDTWLPEQVAFMQSMGNKRANAYWEAELPLHYKRGQIEDFIRAKYVEKRWIPKDSKDRLLSESNPRLLSSRSSRRYGSIAEWTNSQHQCKERRDWLVGENDRAGLRPVAGEVPLRPVAGEVPKASAVNKDQHQYQEKKEKITPYFDQSANSGVPSVNGKTSIEPAQVVRSSSSNGSLRKPEEVSKIRTPTANAMPAVAPPKVDYADVLYRTLCMDDSADNDSSPSMNEWVRFDSDQESSTPVAKLAPKSAASKITSALKKDNVQTTMVPFTTGQYSKDQKYVSNNNQSLAEKPTMGSASSMHLQRLAMPAQGISSANAPKLLKSRTTGSHMMMQNFQPVKSGMNSAPYAMSSLYSRANPSKGVSAPPARGSSGALPVSGYDYDFSYLTQGMFSKR